MMPPRILQQTPTFRDAVRFHEAPCGIAGLQDAHLLQPAQSWRRDMEQRRMGGVALEHMNGWTDGYILLA